MNNIAGRMVQAIKPRNLSVGMTLILIVLYLALTYLVFAILYQEYELSLGIVVFHIAIPSLVFVFLLAFIGYLIQHALSAAYGGRKAADIIASLPMVVVIGLAILIWAGVFASPGEPFATTPSEFKVATALIFGFFALYDIFRDFTGIGRRSTAAYAQAQQIALAREEGAESRSVPSPVYLPSRSGVAERRTSFGVEIVPEFYLVNPADGSRIPIQPTGRILRRVMDYERDQGLISTQPVRQVPTSPVTQAPQAPRNRQEDQPQRSNGGVHPQSQERRVPDPVVVEPAPGQEVEVHQPEDQQPDQQARPN